MNENTEKLRKIIEGSDNIVFFGGAGTSTESGIPDFRSSNGIYSRDYNGLSAEEILSHGFFLYRTEEFYDFYKIFVDYSKAQPHALHRALAQLENEKKLRAVITQNIDGMHQKAGSRRVYELHGSTLRNRCMRCDKEFGIDKIAESYGKVPHCDKCGGVIKPCVVLYEEPLDSSVMTAAAEYISQADVLIVGGTSLTVYPASDFIRYYSGKHLVIINYEETRYDSRAELIIRDPIGKVFEQLGY